MHLPSRRQLLRTPHQAWPSMIYRSRRRHPSLNQLCYLSDFTQGYTRIYEPNAPFRGPLNNAPTNGVPKLTPRELKKYLDKYVVGQERPKVALSTVIYNHYQLVLRRQRLDDEEQDRLARIERAAELSEKHHAESVDEFPDHIISNHNNSRGHRYDRHEDRHQERKVGSPLLEENRPTTIEKSNVLMLGPTGVGKTLIVKTLARILDVPVVICDCTSLTQAGYIGEDVESSVHRLLTAADFDPVKTENGIIFFDETDKIATAKVPHGKDVSGEGVQQALLKIIEGTTLQINIKQGKPRSSSSNSSSSAHSPGNPFSPLSSLGGTQFPKDETYSIRTDNILFIFAGAFVGLDKIVRDRISKSSIGFGSPLRNTSTNGTPSKAEVALIRKSLPFFSTRSDDSHTVLDLVDQDDLGKFGFIPEFIGRIPTITALTHLSIDDLMRILTATKDCKVRQYVSLFMLSGVELRFTTPALQVIAQRALEKGTGARALVSVMENLLKEAMYDTPGSSIKHVLVNRAAAKLECAPLYFARGQENRFQSTFKQEEDAWEVEKARERRLKESEVDRGGGSFEQYRAKGTG